MEINVAILTDTPQKSGKKMRLHHIYTYIFRGKSPQMEEKTPPLVARERQKYYGYSRYASVFV